MKRCIKAACFVLALLTLTIASLPFRSLNIVASDMDLVQVTVFDDENESVYRTGAKTVEAFFKEQKITLGAKDQCDYNPEEPITGEMVITIARGINLSVSIDGVKEKRKVTRGTTVERLMNVLQDEWDTALLFEGDTLREVTENETLGFQTWRSETVTESEAIPFESEEIETTAVLMGHSQIRQVGIPGEKQITTTSIYIGGALSHSEVIAEEIVSEPVMEIIDKGIGGTLGTTTDTSSPSFKYIQKLNLNASAYTAGYESTGKNPGDPGYGITYTGEKVRRGIVSVDPRVIPLGTKLYVEGYGYSLAADTGSGIIGHMIDLFFESLEDALQFGRRTLAVYILG